VGISTWNVRVPTWESLRPTALPCPPHYLSLTAGRSADEVSLPLLALIVSRIPWFSEPYVNAFNSSASYRRARRISTQLSEFTNSFPSHLYYIIQLAQFLWREPVMLSSPQQPLGQQVSPLQIQVKNYIVSRACSELIPRRHHFMFGLLSFRSTLNIGIQGSSQGWEMTQHHTHKSERSSPAQPHVLMTYENAKY
jgi:hypothetical protein